VYDRLIPPLVNWWRGRPFAARMEMHCVPRAEVLAVLETCGGLVLHVDEDVMPGGFNSCRYWIAKRPPSAPIMPPA
jgi:hypothetical protein